MAEQADALVFFGASGDLAYKQIFPALYRMVGHGVLDVPVIGVAKAGWNLDQLKARAKDSLEKHGGLDAEALMLAAGGDAAKAKLTANTEAAAARGAFGIPTVFVDGEIYVGKERLPQLEAQLAA